MSCRVHPRIVVSVLLFMAALPASTIAQPANAKSTSPPDASTSKPKGEAAAISDAERINNLQQSITANQAQLQSLQDGLADPMSDYAQAEQQFASLEAELTDAEEALAKLAGGDAAAIASQRTTVEGIKARWQLARERFDIAIEERRAKQRQVKTLDERIKQDRAALEQLLNPHSAVPSPATTPAAIPPPTAEPSATPGAAPATTATSTPSPGMAGMPTATPPGAASAPGAEESKPAPKISAAQEEKLQDAQATAAVKTTAAAKAQAAVQSITERLAKLEESLGIERELLEAARKKRANSRNTEVALSEQLRKQNDVGADRAQIQETLGQITDAQLRVREAQKEVDVHREQMDKLQENRAQLQSERIVALEKAERAREEAFKAQAQVEDILNPFAIPNIIAWVAGHGPPLIMIVVGIFVLLWLVRVLDRRIVAYMSMRSERGTRIERENRAKTLVSVFHHVANLVIVVGGLLMMMAEANVNIVPLMGAVGVVGLAIAFGAQNLIRDFFSGFVILMENQYTINDVVKIGDRAGLVEKITLRITVLRDLQGVAHFIPNGEIHSVSNMTHDWSRVVLDIGVAYKENVDEVITVLKEVAHEVRNDPDYQYLILEEPEMLGVDAFTDSAVVIKMIIKTRPMQQWTVKRAMLYRIKKRFDELGIEIPFPHRTVYHRSDTDQPIPLAIANRAQDENRAPDPDALSTR